MEKNEQYISLQEAARHCEYSQEYLSLRARQGKLKALKIGRNWVTKKEWIEDYLKNFNNKNGQNFISQKIPEISMKLKEFSLLPKEKFSFPTIKQYSFLNRKFSIPFVKHQPVSITTKEFYFSRKRTPLFFKKIRFDFARILLVVFLISGGFFIFQNFETKNFLKQSAADISKDVFLIAKTMDLKDVQAASATAFKEYGEWLLDSLKNLPINIAKGYLAADKFVEKKLKGGYKLLVDFLNSKKELVKENVSPLSKEFSQEKTKEGMVVLPYEGEKKTEEIANKVKDSFSDEVKVEIKDESSGIITPIFREQKEGDKYFYVLVPLNN